MKLLNSRISLKTKSRKFSVFYENMGDSSHNVVYKHEVLLFEYIESRRHRCLFDISFLSIGQTILANYVQFYYLHV